MPTTSTVLTFCAAALAVLVIPGPAVAYVVTCGIQHGRTAALYSVLGLETGALLHVAAAALGLATLLASSETAYQVVRYAGTLYLILLAGRQFLHRHASTTLARHRRTSLNHQQIYRDGVLVDLLNPKTALFFVAFLPQFIHPAQGPPALQVAVLGGLFVLLAAACDCAYAVAAGGLATRIRESPGWQQGIRRTTGGVYLSLAGLAAFT